MHPVEKEFEAVWNDLASQRVGELRITVAVSGGVDSMVLLDLLLKKIKPHQIVVAHFDHLIRPNSSYQATQLKKECLRMGLKQFVSSSRKGEKTDEQSLRNERHAFLKKVMKETQSQFLMLGHHANDQLETVLMRLVRGTGLYGLSGIKMRNKNIIRPLLRASKRDIVAYASKRKLTLFEDETNRNQKYYRNQIRHQLIPILSDLSVQYGGESKLLVRTQALCEEVADLKKTERAQAKRWIRKHIHTSPTWWCCSVEKWKNLSKGVQKSVAQLIWKDLVGETLETKEIRLLGHALKHSKSVYLSGRVFVSVSCGKAYFQSPSHLGVQKQWLETSLSGLEELVCTQSIGKLRKEIQKLNAELRFLRAGDRYKGKKMKRRCLDNKIPSPERLLLPVIALKDSNEILWYFTQSGDFNGLVQPPWTSIGKT